MYHSFQESWDQGSKTCFIVILLQLLRKLVTQIPGIFRINYIEKHETHQHVKLSLFVHKFGYGYDIHLRLDQNVHKMITL